MSDRWSIYIDIEGFGDLWAKEDHVLWSLGELMRGIFRIARRCYPQPPDRLFAHQFGDGFIVVSDFHESSLERCVTIATALMRHVAGTGRLARATISEGELSDIKGCYPKEVLDCLESEHTVSLEMGLMTIIPVMGTALIRAVKIDKVGPKGPLLLIESSKIGRLGSSASFTSIDEGALMSIDWVHMETELLSKLQENAGLISKSPKELEAMLSRYCIDHKVSDEWRTNVFSLLNVPRTSNYR